MNKIFLAATDAQISECFAVMSQLRPHVSEKVFLAKVKNLTEISGLRLAFLQDENEVKAVAGFRIGQWLAVEGKYLEIEDLVTKNGERSKGYGGELFDWLVQYGKENGCTHLRLVSNVARKQAHRFYERKGMILQAYYFSMDLR